MIPSRNNNTPGRDYHYKEPTKASAPKSSETSKKSTEAAKTALPYKWQQKGDPAVDPNAPWQKEGVIPLKGVKPVNEQHRLELELDKKRFEIKSREKKVARLPVRQHPDTYLFDKIKTLLSPQQLSKELLENLLLMLTPREVEVIEREDSPSEKVNEVKVILRIIAALLKIELQEKELHQSPEQAVRAPLAHTRRRSKENDLFLMKRIKGLLPKQQFASEQQEEFVKNLIQTLTPEKVKALAKNSPLIQREEVASILLGVAKLLAKMPEIPSEEQFSLGMALAKEFNKLEPYLAATKLSSTTIKKTALSFRAGAAATSYAKSNPLTPLKKSINQVSQVHNPNKTLTAYFKKEAPLEPIFWKCVSLLNLEDLFVGTKKAKVKTVEQKVLHGSVQYAQEGILYKDALKNPKLPQPNKQAVHDGVVASIALGVFDLHSANILLDKHGNIHLFDQTRSLPNSNFFLDRGSGVLASPFRCALLASEHSLAPLAPEEKQALKETLQDILGNVDTLNAFFKSDYGLAMLSELPPGWLDAEGAVRAMRDRLGQALLALDDLQVRNLRDLCFAINPIFKFNLILSFAQLVMKDKTNGVQRSPIEIEKKAQDLVGQESFNRLLHSCAVSGFDLEILEEMAFNDTPLEEIAAYIIDAVTHKKLSISPYDEKPMLAKYQANSGIDFKDFRNNQSSLRIIKFFSEQEIKIYDLDKEKPYPLPKGELALAHSKANGTSPTTSFSVVMPQAQGFIFLTLDPLLTPNSYTLFYKSIPLSPLSAEEMVQFMKGRPFPSIRSEMEIIDRLDLYTEELYSLSQLQARNEAQDMGVTGYFIFHLKGSHPLRFFCYHRTEKGLSRYEINTDDPANYQLVLNQKIIADLGSDYTTFQEGLLKLG